MTHLARLLERLRSKPCETTIQETASVKKPEESELFLYSVGKAAKIYNSPGSSVHKLDKIVKYT